MRQHLVTVIAATVAAVSVSFAVAQATSQPAQSSASTDRAILRQLRDINYYVHGTRDHVYDSRKRLDSEIHLLHGICFHTAPDSSTRFSDC